RGTGAVRVDVEAHPRVPLLTVPAPAARDVERHRYQVADLDVLHVPPDVDHLPGDLVPENQAGRGRRAAADHVLVGPADVGRDCLDNGTVVRLAPDVGRVD